MLKVNNIDLGPGMLESLTMDMTIPDVTRVLDVKIVWRWSHAAAV